MTTTFKLSPARRLEIVNLLAAAGEDGVTMRQRLFTPEEIAQMDGLVIRTTSRTGLGVGIYRLSEDGRNYRKLRLGDRAIAQVA